MYYLMQSLSNFTSMTRSCVNCYLMFAIALLSVMSVEAKEITDKLSLNGVLSGALQCQQLSASSDGEDTCKAGVPFQPELTYRPSRVDILFLKLGFAAGNGLNDVSPFNISPWGADLHDDVINVSGSGRNYLLEAWYEHVFEMAGDQSIGLTLGIIDATSFLDQNAYANNEYNQFMNPALSNSPNAIFPSYDLGVATVWHMDQWTFSGVFMEVHQLTSPDKYTFYGVQARYTLETTLGTGHYRVLLNGDRDFVDEAGASKQRNDILIVSIDQQFGDSIGAFTRMGWRLDDSPINYREVYTGGIDISGLGWGRLLDNIGIALGYMYGGNTRIIRTRLAEAYYRMVIKPKLALTFDIQYMDDHYYSIPDAEGMIYSLRATLNF
jgi:porin